MQTVVDHTVVAIVDEMRLGNFIARRIPDTLDWGKGAIQPQSLFVREDDQRTLLKAVLSSIQPVSDHELPFSSCTDGRIPVKLLNGEGVPVREQMVGADIVSAFYVAECLGASFYKDPKAPVAQRVQDVVTFLKENGLQPSSHIACGAGAGCAAIVANIVVFSKNLQFLKRVQTLLPAGIYDEQLLRDIVRHNDDLLAADAYKDLDVQVFIDAVEQVSGPRAVAELRDDGRGVHGHVEEQIIRIHVPGHAINEGRVAELTAGREVFGVNDSRMEKIARLFGRGNDADYRTVYLALELFADAAHATLAKGLPTYIVEAIS
jgi:hypothetical protein